jgi:hypothetical protein
VLFRILVVLKFGVIYAEILYEIRECVMTGLGLGSICIIYKRLRPSQWHRFIYCVMFLTLLPALMSCEMAQNKIQASRAGSEVTSISKITPIAAKPNEVVSLTGSNFYEAKNLKVSLGLANGERATVPLAITNTTTASFTMPDGVGLGVTDVTLTQGSSQVEVARFNLIVDQADNQLPIWIGDASEICNTRDYIDRNGETKTGTKDCASGVTPPACSENGSIGCVTTETYKAADLTNLSASNIKSGVTIAGVTGTVTQSPGDCWASGQQGCVANGSYFAGTMCLGGDSNCFLDDFGGLKAINYSSILTNASNIRSGVTISDVTGTLGDCSANAVTGCVTTATYQSADLTNLSAGNIKSGVTIAGTAGQYPSSSFPLTGSSGTDLTTATFDAQIKSSGTFQYFGSDGVRYTGSGDTDIVDTNIKSAVDIFGITGNVTAGASPNAWDLRAGVTVGSVTGKLKVNCRNRVRSAVYNYDGAIGSIGTSGVSSGTAIDIWDTIDDYNNNVSGLPPSVVPGWENNACGGVDDPSLSTDDDNVWKDVTTTSGGATSNCATDAARCTMQDKITGLWWTKTQSNVTWDAAWSNCQTLSYNGQTGWRLPTQKELMEAYGHGIRSAVSASWITQSGLNNWFWSGSSNSSSSSNAWGVNLSNGYTLNTSITCGVNAYVSKSSTNWHVCVH